MKKMMSGFFLKEIYESWKVLLSWLGLLLLIKEEDIKWLKRFEEGLGLIRRIDESLFNG